MNIFFRKIESEVFNIRIFHHMLCSIRTNLPVKLLYINDIFYMVTCNYLINI